MEIKTFLWNDQENDRGWRVDWATIKATADLWVGIPGIMHLDCQGRICEFEHTSGETLEEAKKKSEEKESKVSEIIRVELVEADHTAYVIHETKNEDLIKNICDGTIYTVSASVWLDDENQFNPVGKFTPIHVSFLSVDGAYGKSAEIEEIGVCETLKNNEEQEISMVEPKPESENQKMAMEDQIGEIHAMLKAMTEKEGPKKEEPKKGAESSASSGKSFDWTKSQTPQKQYLEDYV